MSRAAIRTRRSLSPLPAVGGGPHSVDKAPEAPRDQARALGAEGTSQDHPMGVLEGVSPTRPQEMPSATQAQPPPDHAAI